MHVGPSSIPCHDFFCVLRRLAKTLRRGFVGGEDGDVNVRTCPRGKERFAPFCGEEGLAEMIIATNRSTPTP
jgi:hypothetical protein